MRVLFGGTFDPVHIGHLRMATELAESLAVDQVFFLPCYQAVHKSMVGGTPAQRLAMLRLSVKGNDRLAVDERELERQSASYTIDTLKELRRHNPDESLVLAMGSDAAKDLAGWRDADQFADLCHIVVMERPGHHDPSTTSAVEALNFSVAESVSTLKKTAFGRYLSLRLNLLEISSSDLRRRVLQGLSIRYLVEDAVLDYICDNKLYL